MEKLDRLFEGMIAYNTGDPARIQHLTKVHGFARLIGLAEGLDAHTQFCLEAASYVHDIGIRNAEKKIQKQQRKAAGAGGAAGSGTAAFVSGF